MDKLGSTRWKSRLGRSGARRAGWLMRHGEPSSAATRPKAGPEPEAAPPPGQAWLEIIQRPTEAAFAAAFTKDVVLDASVAGRSIVGPVEVRRFFNVARTLYDAIRFTHETTARSRTCLEWEGVFQGEAIAGATILAVDAEGMIESIRLYHRPYAQVIAFSAALEAQADRAVW
jgi:hypothetical protein